MYTIIETKTYRTDYKKLKNSGNKKAIEELANVTKMLKDGVQLPEKYRDHELEGAPKNEELRDCHIRPDVVLIYKKDENQLILYMIRIGKHSNIFSSFTKEDNKIWEITELKEGNSKYFEIMNKVEKDINRILPYSDCVVSDDYKTIKVNNNSYRVEIKQIPEYYIYDDLGNLLYKTTIEKEIPSRIENFIIEDRFDI